MEIVRATITSYESIEKRDLSLRFIIDDKNYKQVLGIVYGDNLIDINDGNIYYIVKHDLNNFIINDQNIKINTNYALNVRPLEEKDKTYLNFLKAKKRYLEAKGIENSIYKKLVR